MQDGLEGIHHRMRMRGCGGLTTRIPHHLPSSSFLPLPSPTTKLPELLQATSCSAFSLNMFSPPVGKASHVWLCIQKRNCLRITYRLTQHPS